MDNEVLKSGSLPSHHLYSRVRSLQLGGVELMAAKMLGCSWALWKGRMQHRLNRRPDNSEDVMKSENWFKLLLFRRIDICMERMDRSQVEEKSCS